MAKLISSSSIDVCAYNTCSLHLLSGKITVAILRSRLLPEMQKWKTKGEKRFRRKEAGHLDIISHAYTATTD